MVNRRKFLKRSISSSAALWIGYDSLYNTAHGKTNSTDMSFTDYVHASVLPKEEIDIFLDPDEPTWAQYDPELGYILGNYMPHDGIDNSMTISTVLPNGMRTNQIYRDKSCRINTYGNSFTHCHQVCDAETWQEYLAGHLGEPIRNYGMGGYGVYQSYRRMLREERTVNNAEYITLYMWGDDYLRSVLRCRYVLFYPHWDNEGGKMFHGNFWPNIEMDLTAGQLVEKENLLSTPESMYRMSDPDYMVHSLHDDLMLQLCLIADGKISSGYDKEKIGKLADIFVQPNIVYSNDAEMKQSIKKLRDTYSFEATKYILKKTREFVIRNNKKLLVIQFCPGIVTKQLIETGKRYDQEIVDFLLDKDFNYFDMNDVHVNDYKFFNLSIEDYYKRYFIGHYNPGGNHFFAYSIKKKIVDWLDPKPITYQDAKQSMINFKGYLPD